MTGVLTVRRPDGSAARYASRAQCERALIAHEPHSLWEFVQLAWPHVDTSPPQWNWHHEAICDHLEAVQRGEIRELVINVPPGTSKSTLVCVLYPAWVWTRDPGHRFIAATYDDDLALRDARRHRRLVDSAWWRDRWPEVALPRARDESTAVGLFFNTRGGMRNSITVKGGATGKHAHTHLVDDPVDVKAALQVSHKDLENAIEWWDKEMTTRACDPATLARILVQQRVHQKDLSAHLAAAGAVVLSLPMRFERAHPHRYARDPRPPAVAAAHPFKRPCDPRVEEGELLHAARFPPEVVALRAGKLGPTQAAAQEQQRPAPAGGGMFKAEYFRRRWVEFPTPGPGLTGTMSLSVDCTFKGKGDVDWVVIQCWLKIGATFYLLDQVRGRWGFAETCVQLLAFCARWPQATQKLVEAKANGTAVVDVLKDKVPGLVEVEPQGGKEARAAACEPLWAADNVVLPDAALARYPDGRVGAPWVGSCAKGEPEPDAETFAGEHLVFPRGAHDDQVDAATQYLIRAAGSFAARFTEAMARFKPGGPP